MTGSRYGEDYEYDRYQNAGREKDGPALAGGHYGSRAYDRGGCFRCTGSAWDRDGRRII